MKAIFAWICQKCGRVNSNGSDRCQRCGATRPVEGGYHAH